MFILPKIENRRPNIQSKMCIYDYHAGKGIVIVKVERGPYKEPMSQ